MLKQLLNECHLLHEVSMCITLSELPNYPWNVYVSYAKQNKYICMQNNNSGKCQIAIWTRSCVKVIISCFFLYVTLLCFLKKIVLCRQFFTRFVIYFFCVLYNFKILQVHLTQKLSVNEFAFQTCLSELNNNFVLVKPF